MSRTRHFKLETGRERVGSSTALQTEPILRQSHSLFELRKGRSSATGYRYVQCRSLRDRPQRLVQLHVRIRRTRPDADFTAAEIDVRAGLDARLGFRNRPPRDEP